MNESASLIDHVLLGISAILVGISMVAVLRASATERRIEDGTADTAEMRAFLREARRVWGKVEKL
jgi:hypothetical protein